VRRGLPLFYPVRKNLRRAEKLLRNMSVVTEIQSAIALIRKHRQGTATVVQQFVASQADAAITSPTTGQTRTFRRYGPGTILDANANIEYDFPAASVDAANFVAVLQAELRAVASRLVMPEFMLTSDTSNANYSSTMVAEGPAIRMFARLQAEQVCDDLEVMWRAVNSAIASGKLPPETATLINIQAAPPMPVVLDQLKEAQRFRIENAAGILPRKPGASAMAWITIRNRPTSLRINTNSAQRNPRQFRKVRRSRVSRSFGCPFFKPSNFRCWSMCALCCKLFLSRTPVLSFLWR
jgi:hypothetical protein